MTGSAGFSATLGISRGGRAPPLAWFGSGVRVRGFPPFGTSFYREVLQRALVG